MNNTLTGEERELFIYLITSKEGREQLQEHLGEGFTGESYEADDLALRESLYQQLNARMHTTGKAVAPIPIRKLKPARAVFLQWAAAAAVVIMIGAGSYLLTRSRPGTAGNHLSAARTPEDLKPGGNKATLYLSNGQTIVLDSAQNGQVAAQGSTTVIKLNNRLAYQHLTDAGLAATVYNVLKTPRGGQYQVQLPDGTEVWLNAASSLRFPTAFNGHERRVSVNGEAYFEVSKDPGKPFIVDILNAKGENEGAVQVYGTHFNINAYDDEPSIKTTLLEGSVKMTHASQEVFLTPNQQAEVSAGKDKIKVKVVDPDEVIGWKNGTFIFNNTNIYAITRQISRWYDVDVIYKDSIPLYLNGDISRNVNVSNVFKILELTGEAHFSVNNHSILITR